MGWLQSAEETPGSFRCVWQYLQRIIIESVIVAIVAVGSCGLGKISQLVFVVLLEQRVLGGQTAGKGLWSLGQQ